MWGVLCREKSKHTHPSSWCFFSLSTSHQASRTPSAGLVVFELFIPKWEEEFPPNNCHSNLISHLKYMWVNSLVGSHNCLDLHIISPSPSPPAVRTSHGRPSDIERTKPSPWAPSCKKPWLSQTSSWSLGGQRNLQLESEKRIRIIILTSKNREIKEKLEALKLI